MEDHEIETKYFDDFTKWKESKLAEGIDIGDTFVDWYPWYVCFVAGYKAAETKR